MKKETDVYPNLSDGIKEDFRIEREIMRARRELTNSRKVAGGSHPDYIPDFGQDRA
jgi:hypothetical protein